MKEFFFDKSFSQAEIDNLFLSGNEFENCLFDGCILSSVSFEKTIFIDCTFSQCDLNNVSLKTTALKGVTFNTCKLNGIHFEFCPSFMLEMNFVWSHWISIGLWYCNYSLTLTATPLLAWQLILNY